MSIAAEKIAAILLAAALLSGCTKKITVVKRLEWCDITPHNTLIVTSDNRCFQTNVSSLEDAVNQLTPDGWTVLSTAPDGKSMELEIIRSPKAMADFELVVDVDELPK